VDDDDNGISFSKWRTAWLKRGAPWSSTGHKAPKAWDGKIQAAAATPAKKTAPKAKKSTGPKP